jgi:FSR family fosmidomycin resistance protein-like MFS transporter
LVIYPASGAFVGLSQASLMDTDPKRRDQQMARWAFAGSLGVVAGPLILSVGIASGVGWRGLFAMMLVLTVAVLLLAGRSLKISPLGTSDNKRTTDGFFEAFREALKSLTRREVARWLVLLEFSDLMWDVLHGFMALYFVDVVGVTPVQAGLAIGLWTGVGLLGDFALIPLLERVRGLTYLRISAFLTLILFPAFLIVDDLWIKLPILALLGLLNAGWYAILKAQLYDAMPGQSGRVMTVSNISGLIGGLIPLGLGWVAQQYNLETAMWILVAGPVALILGIPRHAREGA